MSAVNSAAAFRVRGGVCALVKCSRRYEKLRESALSLDRLTQTPDAGTMQRVRLKAERNIGFCAMVSARALNVEGTSLDVGHVAKVFPHSGNYKGLGSAIRAGRSSGSISTWTE
jgi:hypothetical protein